MAITLFGKRTPVKQRPAKPDTATQVGYNPTDLQSRMQGAAKGGGGIQPGAHPEFDQPTPLDNLTHFFTELFKDKGKKK